jgi:hypothetical protein
MHSQLGGGGVALIAQIAPLTGSILAENRDLANNETAFFIAPFSTETNHFMRIHIPNAYPRI